MSITRSVFIFKRCIPCGHADNGEQMPYPFPGFHMCSPFFSFDCITISIPLLTDISADKLVIVVTHNYEQFRDHATRIIKMHDGKIVEDTGAAAVRTANEAAPA